MRTRDETSGETARETDDATESRRWVLRDRPEPLPPVLHVLIGLVLLVLLIVAAYRI